MLFLRFLTLVVILNVLRYLLGFLVEPVAIFPGLSAAMEDSASYFNVDFETFDWVTSFFYNFMMWLVVVWIYHICRPVVKGSEIVSFIYMNHYSHPKAFYFWNVLDGAIVYAIVAVSNGLLYPRLMSTTDPAEAVA